MMSLLGLSLTAGAQQAPVMNQSTSNPQQARPARPQAKPVNPNQNREAPIDTTRPGRRKLRPDSLRRGGAVRIDTIR